MKSKAILSVIILCLVTVNVFSQNGFSTVEIWYGELKGMRFKAKIDYKPDCAYTTPIVRATLHSIEVESFEYKGENYTQIDGISFPITVTGGYLEMSMDIHVGYYGNKRTYSLKKAHLSTSVGGAGNAMMADEFRFVDGEVTKLKEHLEVSGCSDLLSNNDFVNAHFNGTTGSILMGDEYVLEGGNFEYKNNSLHIFLANRVDEMLDKNEKAEEEAKKQKETEEQSKSEKEDDEDSFIAQEKGKAKEAMQRIEAEQRIQENKKKRKPSYSSNSKHNYPHNSSYTPSGQGKINALNTAQKSLDDFFEEQADRDRQRAQEKSERFHREQREMMDRINNNHEAWEKEKRIKAPYIKAYEETVDYVYQQTVSESELFEIFDEIRRTKEPSNPFKVSVIPIIENNCYTRIYDDYVVNAYTITIHKPVSIDLSLSGTGVNIRKKIKESIESKIDLKDYKYEDRYLCDERLRYLDVTNNSQKVEEFYEMLYEKSRYSNINVSFDKTTMSAVSGEIRSFLNKKAIELRSSINPSVSSLRNKNVFKSLDGSEWRLKIDNIMREDHFIFTEHTVHKFYDLKSVDIGGKQYVQEANSVRFSARMNERNYKIISQQLLQGVKSYNGKIYKWELVRVKDSEVYEQLKSVSDMPVYKFVEKMPQGRFWYKGEKGIEHYIQKNLKYPVGAKMLEVEETVTVEFIVEKDGSITNAKIVGFPHPSLEKEALRLVRSMPKWTPGEQRGKPVRVKRVIKIKFEL